eukprot:Awhi_evm1s13724
MFHHHHRHRENVEIIHTPNGGTIVEESHRNFFGEKVIDGVQVTNNNNDFKNNMNFGQYSRPQPYYGYPNIQSNSSNDNRRYGSNANTTTIIENTRSPSYYDQRNVNNIEVVDVRPPCYNYGNRTEVFAIEETRSNYNNNNFGFGGEIDIINVNCNDNGFGAMGNATLIEERRDGFFGDQVDVEIINCNNNGFGGGFGGFGGD